MGKQPVPLGAEAQAGVQSDELDHGEAGGEISTPVRSDAAVVAAHDTDDGTEEDATPNAFLVRKREVENNDDAVSTRILCDRRTNSTDQICLGSTIVSWLLSLSLFLSPSLHFLSPLPCFLLYAQCES